MRLDYQLEEKDLVAFNLYHQEHSELHRKYRNRHRFLVPVVYAVLAMFMYRIHADIAAALMVVFAVGWFAASPVLYRRRIRTFTERHVRENAISMLKSPMTIELSDNGIHSTSSIGESTYHYSSVEKVVSTDAYTFVFIGKAMALILPHDRLPKEQIDEFVAEIEKRKGSAPP